MRWSLETHQEIYITTLEVILSVTAHPFDGGLNGLDCGLKVFNRVTRVTTVLLGSVWSPEPERRRPDSWNWLVYGSREIGLWRAKAL